LDKKVLDENVRRIQQAAGDFAKISVEQNEKNGSVAVRITLYEKKKQ
jgi:hypothetical protein